MQESAIHQIFWAVKALAWLSIIYCSFRLKLVGKYPSVFVYIFTAISLQIVMLAAARFLGNQSLTYSYLYVARSLATIGLAAFVLLKVYALLGPFKLRNTWHMIAVAVVAVVLSFSDSRGAWIYFRLLDAGYATLSYFGVVTVLRMKTASHVALGWNLKMMLLALTMPAVFYSIVFMAYTMGLDFSREQADLWTNGIGVGAWVIIAVGMSNYSPPLFIGAKRGSAANKRDSEEIDSSVTKGDVECCIC